MNTGVHASVGGFLRVALGIAAVAFVGMAGVYLRSERELARRHVLPSQSISSDRGAVLDADVAAGVDADLLDRGRHLVTVVAQCSYCHGPDLAGREMADDPWIGRLYASNLTRGVGGIGGAYSDAEWDAALRHGIAPDGRSLLLMPSGELAQLTDRDLAAVVAYVRSVPAVDRVVPGKRPGWLTRFVVALGLAPDLISAEQVEREAGRRSTRVLVAHSDAPTAGYGEYLVALGSCRICHRADLAGGLHPLSLPGEPVPPDLTPNGPLAGWSREDFAIAMREGRTPDGRLLDREFMPWPAFAGLREVEIDALWLYLESLGRVADPRADDRTLAGGPVGPHKG